jgi:hypothetical protein
LGFSYGCLAFSIDISFYSPGYFIVHFIWMPGIFNGYFILGPRIFHFTPQDISLCISYGCLAFSMDISFLASGYFIALKIAIK